MKYHRSFCILIYRIDSYNGCIIIRAFIFYKALLKMGIQQRREKSCSNNQLQINLRPEIDQLSAKYYCNIYVLDRNQ